MIHSAVMGQDLRTDSSKIRLATRSALSLAESRGIKSIAFPALGTGVGGFSFSEAAKIMVDESLSFLRKSKKTKIVTFVLYGDEAYKSFANVIRDFEK